jgi:tetratricopeptide (TPR) repeat protein
MRRSVRVSLTMIVKNEEANLPRCLESVRGLFDEIIVLDTGSTDRTVEIARSFGARVFDFVWVDDFAAARNAALARATGDYALWLDADDVVEPSEYGMLDRLFAHLQLGDDAAYVIRCACDPDAEGGGGATVVDHVRLFPVRENVRWSYRVHEQILPALRRAGIPDRWTDIVIRHTGYTDRALRARKLQRDEKILLEELEERPKDPFVLFNLGSIAIEREDWQAAIRYLDASLVGLAAEDSITRKLYALISRAHQGLGDTLAALAVCSQGLEVDPQDAELWFRKGFVHRQRGEHESAEACRTTILGLRRPTRFSSVDMGIYGHLTHRNLAVLALERGDVAKSLAHWKAVVCERPNDLSAQQQIKQLSAPSDGTPQSAIRWIVPGSFRRIVAVSPGQCGEFAPFSELAIAWARALQARVIVELGARFGETTGALLEAISGTNGHIWAIDPYDRHGIEDPAFTYIRSDPREVVDRFETIDYLHVDVDPNTHGLAASWLEFYASKARAVALYDTHHPLYQTGAAAFALASQGVWRVFEYWDGGTGWTVVVRPNQPTPHDSEVAAGGAE